MSAEDAAESAPTGVLVIGRDAAQRCFSASDMGPVRWRMRSGTAREGPSMTACSR
ncbi:hypothetical protein ACFRFL_20810 [Streptomyces sp. NPDC056708]|uniref:hypothetical protein n=1 Tax=unclassified Streptomyces TaxID=2593676 RepID=UPI0036BC0086